MDSQFGLISLWTQGDWVIRSIALLLLLMSLASWSVILIKAIKLYEYRNMSRSSEAFWHSADFDAGLQALGGKATSPYVHMAQAGLAASRHHNQHCQPEHRELHNALDISDWIARAVHNAMDDTSARLQSGLAVLASVGSTAPFVGLFGTVWGIYHALVGISVNGQASLDQVAGPIGESLVMTALGLAVAIPAVLGYNALVRGNKAVSARLHRFAHDLHAYFVTGARIGTAQHTAKV